MTGVQTCALPICAKVIYDMIVNDKSNSFEWFIMGGIGTEDLFHLQQHNLTKTGWYQKNDIFDLLKDNAIDIVCILSIVAETFCYTLSESLAVGIPVIATDVGALGRRVRESECGWVVEDMLKE